MKTAITIILFFISSLIYSQPQYNSVFVEKDSIDENNRIYKTGMAFIFDYEIVRGNDTLKLKYNNPVERPLINFDSIDMQKYIKDVQKQIERNIRNGENSFPYSFEYSNIDSDSIGVKNNFFFAKSR